jgi:hypothetical protein
MKVRPPIIIIGMHRSGTSLVSRMLETLGLFVGRKKETNNEALLFQELNIWILRQSGGAWDYPQSVKQLLKNSEIRVLVEDYIMLMLNSPRVISFLGWGKYLRYRKPFQLDISWGWKDPRNTFTLPLWLDLFPDAKVIHVYRHGVDVANSLLTRQQKWLQRSRNKYHKLKWAYLLHRKQKGFTDSLRCATLEGGFSLWEEYMQEARSHVKMMGNRATEVKFESLIENPHIILKSLAEFCELKPSEEALTEITPRQIKPDRAYAYRNNPVLKAFAQNVSDRLRTYGYGTANEKY